MASSDPFKPLATGWLDKIEEAKLSPHRKLWKDTADECMMFYSAATGFMWDDKYKHKFWDGKATPRFRMTINKAFEMVALFGPLLYWKNPHRTAHIRRPLDLDPSLMVPQMPPQLQQMAQQLQQMQQGQQPGMPPPPMNPQAMQAQQQVMAFQQMQQQAQMAYDQSSQQQQLSENADKMRAQLMERWLNYTPGELPGGGLKQHSQAGITDALIKGRGCEWAETYTFPGSQRKITGLFYDAPENLIIDPDATSLYDAKWIAKECTHPIWQVEREYSRPQDSLKNAANDEGLNSAGERRSSDDDRYNRRNGKTFDLMTYYKVWSKGGVGGRLSGVKTLLRDALDEVVGDYAYCVVARGVDYPLNAPTEQVQQAGDEDIQRIFSWPVPFWKDDRWPVVCLDFYPKPGSAYPIAPLSPGLGELKFLNTMISHLANRIWSSSRDFWAVAKSAVKDLESIITNGKDQCIIEVAEIHEDVRKLVSIIQQPQTNFDVWKIMEQVMELFNQRTGLNELFYGMNPGDAQSRTATDAATKKQNISIRPDYMAECVETWQSEGAVLESFLTSWDIGPEEVAPLLGPAGAMLWQQLISGQDMESVVRQYKVTIEAGSIRKPNRDKDLANAQAVMQMLNQTAVGYATASTDTKPLNAMVQSIAEATDDDDLRHIQFGPWAPPAQPGPTPEQLQMQLNQQQMQINEQKANIDQQKAAMEHADRQQQMQFQFEEHTMDLAAKQAETNQEVQSSEAVHKQDIRHANAEHKQKLQIQKKQAAAAA